MKKVKKFFRDNGEVIGGILMGVGATMMVGVLVVEKIKTGHQLSDAFLLRDEKTKELFLHLEYLNGTSKNYLWDPTRK